MAVDYNKFNKAVEGINGAIPGILSMTGSIVANTKAKDTSAISAQLAGLEDTYYTPGNYDNILDSYYSNVSMVPQIDRHDYYQDPGYYAGNILNAGFAGRSAGDSIGGIFGHGWGWGGLIGAGAGVIGSSLATIGAEKEAEENYLFDIDRRNRALAENTYKMNTAIKNTKDLLASNAMRNLVAFGGKIQTSPNPADFTNGVKVIENGGSHEENPMQGVPMGIAEDGKPNLVEEGEVIYDNYVFSKRLLADGGLLQTMNLPKRYEGKDFAYIAKKLSEESKDRPLDYISQNGLNANLSKLAQVQEIQRQRQAEYQEYEQIEDAYSTMAAEGGSIHIKPSKKGTFTALATRKGMSLSELSNDIQAHPEKYSPEARKKEVFYRNFARKKAEGGHLFAGGSTIPLAFIGSENWIPEEEVVESPIFPTQIVTEYNPSYNLTRVPIISDTKEDTVAFPSANRSVNPIAFSYAPKSALDSFHNNYPLTAKKNDVIITPKQANNELPSNNVSDTDDVVATQTAGYNQHNLRDWPILASSIQAFADAMGWTNQPDYTTADIIGKSAGLIPNVTAKPFGRRARITPVDKNLSRINAENLMTGYRRAIADLSGGNSAIARAALAGTMASGVEAIGDMQRKEELAQEEKELRALQMDNALEQALAQNELQAAVRNQAAGAQRAAIMRDWANARDIVDTAISEAKSKNITNANTLIGQGGLDKENQRMALQYIASKGLLDEYLANLKAYNTSYACGGKMRGKGKKKLLTQ